MVARMLLQRPKWESLSELGTEIQAAGVVLSLPQVSKAVQAMGEDLIVSKVAGVIALNEPLRLLDKLSENIIHGADGGGVSGVSLVCPAGSAALFGLRQINRPSR
jgi:hypothetical protein